MRTKLRLHAPGWWRQSTWILKRTHWYYSSWLLFVLLNEWIPVLLPNKVAWTPVCDFPSLLLWTECDEASTDAVMLPSAFKIIPLSFVERRYKLFVAWQSPVIKFVGRFSDDYSCCEEGNSSEQDVITFVGRFSDDYSCCEEGNSSEQDGLALLVARFKSFICNQRMEMFLFIFNQ